MPSRPLRVRAPWPAPGFRRAGRLDAGRIVTHRFGFDEVPQAYDVFDDPVVSGALKVAVLRG